MLKPSSSEAILPFGYLTLATMTFSANYLEIFVAISKGVVSKLIPSLTEPSRSVIVIACFGRAAYLAFWASKRLAK